MALIITTVCFVLPLLKTNTVDLIYLLLALFLPTGKSDDMRVSGSRVPEQQKLLNKLCCTYCVFAWLLLRSSS